MNMYDVAYLLRNRIKTLILKQLDKPTTATALSKRNRKHRSAMSSVLIELEKQGFAICLNPRHNMNRFYQITDRGKQALSRLKEFE